ncbi:MAG: hypothetical protein KC588_13150, partial [Nitrospira sp.]|nr:hypothetical protein [Nitrospira sp.]
SLPGGRPCPTAGKGHGLSFIIHGNENQHEKKVIEIPDIAPWFEPLSKRGTIHPPIPGKFFFLEVLFFKKRADQKRKKNGSHEIHLTDYSCCR